GGGKYLRDSASGSHCTDFTNFERTADLKSSSLLKFVKNSTSNTANLRILESQSSNENHKSHYDKQLAPQSPDSSSTILESHIALESNFPSLRVDNDGAAVQPTQSRGKSNLEKNSSQTKLESSFKKVNSMDCHDLPSKSHNDRKPSPTTLASNDSFLDSSLFLSLRATVEVVVKQSTPRKPSPYTYKVG
ncbi:MAG: hypothetical protein IKB69_08000, partial [Helicobacter sp.]|nr:hypothetical protein [Helicobacter sp.]